MLSGILTDGGTILGTSRDKPHRMNIGGKELDMTDAIIATYHRHHLDALVCIGRRRHPEKRAAPVRSRAERGDPAQDHRQRHRDDGPHVRL